MKLLTLTIMLLFQIPLFAQLRVESKANIQLVQQQDRAVPLRAKEQITSNERETSKLAQTYQNATAEQKTSIQKQIRDLLYKTLDLKIQVKEEKVAFLTQELNSMKQQGAIQEIESIEKDLEEIKKDIVYRRKNRDKIVALRLKELIQL